MNHHSRNQLADNSAALANRRQFLGGAGVSIGGIALASLLDGSRTHAASASPYTAKPTHFAPKAKRVIHICALGGASHIDLFDYKPELEQRDGQEYKDEKYDPFFGQPGKLLKSPFKFERRGQSGLHVSSLLPQMAECVDDMAFVYSMFSKTSNHTPGTFLENTGFTFSGFPGVGAWVSYGLGSENENLPAYVVLPDPRQLPAGGSINWTSGFLPAVHQGVPFQTQGEPIANLFTPESVAANSRAAGMDFLAKMNRDYAAAHAGDEVLSSRVRAYEMAARMQLSVPELVDLSRETAATKELYGVDDASNAGFGRTCLLARRLSEQGVRFVQVFNGGAFGQPRINWDAHENLVENHNNQAAVMDRPVAALLKDLKARGLLDETVVLWTTEFGRTPVTQGLGGKGRDHHPTAFTVWMAGAGLKRGIGYGSSDELGFYAADKPTQFYDIHATLLHLLGMDHTRLTFYHNGIHRRLTDVHGEVIKGLLM